MVLYRELQLALVMTLLKRPTLRGRPLGFGTFCLVLQGRFSARFRKCAPESHKTGHATNLFDSSKVAVLPAEKKQSGFTVHKSIFCKHLRQAAKEPDTKNNPQSFTKISSAKNL